ncbi:MAG: hypothetical protein EP310_05790 [Bacteroidetes bacterium]|nr:MAG: hypothetical protein EP310_05790 [Bacteroidota bacterium]
MIMTMKNIRTIFLFLAGLTLIVACEQNEEPLPVVKLTINATNPTAYGAADGTADLTIEGLESVPYLVSWNTGETTEDISGLKAGTYSVKVIYLSEAVANKSVVLTEPEPNPLSLTFDVKQPSKWGYQDGAINLTVGNGVSPYTFLWSNGTKTQNLKGIKAGLYSVKVTDSNPHAPVVTEGMVEVGQPEFVCGVDSLMDVDGNKYPTVLIGDQCWTAVNIRTAHKPGWDPKNPALKESDFIIEGRYCQGNNCTNEMGSHYTWQAMMNGTFPAEGEMVQGIAPDGWHIPNLDEWKELNDWLKVDGNGGPGTNVPNKMRGNESSSGFDALYAGNWGYGVFTGDIAVFWTATPLLDADGNPTGRAYYRLINNLPLFGQGHDITDKGLSVRLVKNK